MGKKGGSSAGGSGGGDSADGKDVVALDAQSFKKMLQDQELWMVEFYAPW